MMGEDNDVDEGSQIAFVVIYVLSIVALMINCTEASSEDGINGPLRAGGLLCIAALVIIDSIMAHQASGSFRDYSIAMAVCAALVLLPLALITKQHLKDY